MIDVVCDIVSQKFLGKVGRNLMKKADHAAKRCSECGAKCRVFRDGRICLGCVLTADMKAGKVAKAGDEPKKKRAPSSKRSVVLKAKIAPSGNRSAARRRKEAPSEDHPAILKSKS